MPLKVAIFVSGRGSNMEAILNATKSGGLGVNVSVVVSNDPDAPALETARSHGIETIAVSHKKLTREEHELRLLDELKKFDFDFIVLAGYMRILSPGFLKNFKDPAGYFKVINIHPSLLPAFPGKSAYEDAFDYGVKLSGITVHLVDEKVDHGPILAQDTFERKDDDTLQDFKARGLKVEHRLYPAVLHEIATQGVKLVNRRTESVIG